MRLRSAGVVADSSCFGGRLPSSQRRSASIAVSPSGRCLDRVLQRREQRVEVVEDDRLLGREVGEERARRDVGRRGDVRHRRGLEARARANSANAASTICSRVRCFLRSRRPVTTQRQSSLRANRIKRFLHSLQFRSKCDSLKGMAHALGRLAAAAAGHWKRSLAIVAAVLVAIGAASALGGGAFVDSFSTPGTESQKALDLLTQRFPAQSGDTATLVFAGQRPQDATRRSSRPGRRCSASRTSPASAPLQLSRDQRIGFLDRPVRQARAGPPAGAGERLADVSKTRRASRRSRCREEARSSTRPSSSAHPSAS